MSLNRSFVGAYNGKGKGYQPPRPACAVTNCLREAVDKFLNSFPSIGRIICLLISGAHSRKGAGTHACQEPSAAQERKNVIAADGCYDMSGSK